MEGGSLLGRLRLAGLTEKDLGPKCPQLCPLRFPAEMLAAALINDVPHQTLYCTCFHLFVGLCPGFSGK